MDLGGGAAEDQLVFSPMVLPRGILHDEPPGDILVRSAPAQPSLHAHSISHLDCQGRIDLRGAARRRTGGAAAVGARGHLPHFNEGYAATAAARARRTARSRALRVRLAAALNSER